MSRWMLILLVLGFSLLLLSGCTGGSPAKPSSNNTSNASVANPSPAPNLSAPQQNQSPPPSPPAPNETNPVPPVPPVINNTPSPEPVTPPAIIVIPTVSGDAVIDPTNGTFTTHSCYGVEAQPAVIQAGKESVMHFRGYAAHGEAITYTCGDEVRSNGNGGLIDFTRICFYPNAGHYAVWLALDGFVCASVPLQVEPADAVSPSPTCAIAANSQDEERNGTTTTYSAKVMLYNQPSGASVDWDCGPTHFNRTIGSAFDPAGSGAPGSLVSGALLVTCRFDTWPPPAPGSVSIGGADCGPMASG